MHTWEETTSHTRVFISQIAHLHTVLYPYYVILTPQNRCVACDWYSRGLAGHVRQRVAFAIDIHELSWNQ